MPEGSSSKSDFKFILNSVRSDAAEAVSHELTQLFPVDGPTAANIVRNAPIILLDNLSPQQARKVGTYAIRLKALGADVQVTGQPVGKLQVLRWPLLPDIAKRPGNHVICPNCGARLQMQILMPAAEPVAPPAVDGNPSDTGVIAPITEPPAEGAAPPPPDASSEPAAADPSAELEPESPAAPGEEDVIEEVILEPVDDEPEEEEASVESLMEGDEPMIHEPDPAIEVASDVPLALGGDGTCRVSLVGKTKGKKKLKAAELMARYLGIEEDEALARLNKRSVVTVATDLSDKQADRCKKEFADIGVKVTIKG